MKSHSYPIISAADATRYLRGRENSEEFPLSEITQTVGSGTFIDLGPIDCLVEFMTAQIETGGFPKRLAHRSEEGGRFESVVVSEAYRVLSAYPEALLTDRGFWVWLAIARFSTIIDWRFGAEEKPAKEANYGIGSRGSDNFLFRLWVRGDIGRDPESGDMDLATVGNQDLWRSHIMRQNYANAREVAKGLLRLQAGKLNHKPLNNDQIRELAKLLRRINSNLFLAVLTKQEVENLLYELIPMAQAMAVQEKQRKSSNGKRTNASRRKRK